MSKWERQAWNFPLDVIWNFHDVVPPFKSRFRLAVIVPGMLFVVSRKLVLGGFRNLESPVCVAVLIAIKHGKRMPLLVSDRAMACRHLSCLKARASVP
eukprot:scaffold48413_cov19-Tisochrysis_lutea.AAC.3